MSEQKSDMKSNQDWSLLEAAPLAMMVSTLSGEVLFANQRISDLIGIPLDEIIGHATPDFYAVPEERQAVLTKIQKQGGLENYELQIKKQDGTLLWVLLSVQMIDHQGQPAFLSMLLDITETKQAEQELKDREERLRAIYEGTNDAVMLLTPDGFFDCNPRTLELFGFETVEEFIKVHPADISPPQQPDGRESFPSAQAQIKQAFEQGSNRFDWVHRRANGEDFPAEVLLSRFELQGNTVLQATVRDITERQQAVNALQRLAAIAESSNEAMFSTTPKGEVLSWNPAAERMFGYTPDEIIGQSVGILAPAELQDQARQLLMGLAQGQDIPPLETIRLAKDGRRVEVLLSASAIKDDDGNVVGFSGILSNITERREAEQIVQQSEQLLNSFINNFPDGVWAKDLEGRFVLANSYIQEEIAGTEIIGKTVYDTMPKENADAVWASEKRLLETGEPVSIEENVPHADGKIYKKLTIKFPFYDTTGNISGVGGILIDITDRKQVEEALRENEDRFRRFTEATAEGLVFHEDGKIIDVNPAAVNMFGYAEAESLLGRNLMEFVLPEFHQLVLEKMQLENVDPYRIEGIHKEGHSFQIETSTRTYELGGKIVRATSVRDITERHRVEEQIATFQALVENSADAITMSNLEGNISYANRAAYDLLGYDDKKQELIGKPTVSLASPEEQERQGQAIGQIMATGSSWSDEATAFRSDGREVTVAITMFPVLGANDQPAYIAAILRDISEEKQAAQALQESQRLLQLVMDNIPQAVFWKSRDLVYLGGNQAFAEDAGLESADELAGKTDFDMPWTEQAELYRADDQKVMDQGEDLLNFEEPQVNAAGEYTWLRTSKIPMKDEEGNVFAVLGMYEDITNQKQAEQELQESQQLLNSFLNNFPDAAWAKDMEGHFLLANRYLVENIYGTTADEVIGKTVYETFPKDVADFVWSSEKQLLETGESIAVEEDIPQADGQIYNKITTKFPLYDAEGNITGLGGVLIDITERKKLDQQVQEAFERRGYQVQISTEISQEIAQAAELSELFDRVVTLTKERLGYYHTQLLRYEPTQNAVVLITGYGETGQKMAAEGHRMPMGSGLIGTAAATGETVLRPDLTTDSDWQANPLLPETRGEVAVPIKLGDAVLGVLDVQSDTANGLTDDDRLLLEGLCGQIAIAMEQTRLRQEMSERLEEINRLYRSMSQEGWQAFRTSTALPEGFQFDQSGVSAIGSEGEMQSMTAAPLTVPGGQTVGTLALDDLPENPLSAEDQIFLTQVAEQVALALESARLFDEAQTRTEELDILNEMGRALTSMQDEQAIYETIYEYAGKLMDVSSFHIALYHEDEQEYSLPIMTEQGKRVEMPNQPAGNGLTDYIIKNRQPLLFSQYTDSQAEELGIDPITVGDDLPTLSWLGVPLIFQDRILGVVGVQSDTLAGLYTEHERDLLTAIASQAAIAIENVTTFRQTQQQAEREAMINLISQRIQGTTSVESALQVAIRELGRALGAKRTNVQLGLPSQQKPKK